MAAPTASRPVPWVLSKSYPAWRAAFKAARYSASNSGDMCCLDITPAPPWITSTNDLRLSAAAWGEVATVLISSSTKLRINHIARKDCSQPVWISWAQILSQLLHNLYPPPGGVFAIPFIAIG